MSRTARASTVASHPAVREIESALDAGEPYRSISSKYGVSRSALSRFVLSRRPLVRILDDEPNVTDVVSRLVEVANDAQELRRASRQSSNHAGRARSIKVEVDALTMLAGRLGIDDTTAEGVLAEAFQLVKAVAKFSDADPEGATALLVTMREFPALEDLTSALRKRMKDRNAA